LQDSLFFFAKAVKKILRVAVAAMAIPLRNIQGDTEKDAGTQDAFPLEFAL
jgi:hypothetical protein